MPQVTGLLETALYVDDVARAQAFYERVLGFQTMTVDDRFCAMSVPGRHVLLLFRKGASANGVTIPGGSIPSHDGDGHLHLAFSVARSEWDAWHESLRTHGVEVEGEVTWPMGGRSVYFRDPDGHLVELATSGIWAIF
jgi:catechol 2,3-dioxygenase-like lactoylglutathione lyase family enzyme